MSVSTVTTGISARASSRDRLAHQRMIEHLHGDARAAALRAGAQALGQRLRVGPQLRNRGLVVRVVDYDIGKVSGLRFPPTITKAAR